VSAWVDSRRIFSLSFCLGVCIIVPLGAIMQSHSSLALENQKNGNNNTQSPCNCVIFRMDDVQDNFIDEAQAAAMNLFILKNQPLTLGLIMNDIGNDMTISQHIAKGIEKGLFELGLHGWDHVDYTKLSEEHQKDSLKKANDKMQGLYGNTSNIFITPYGKFNDETINAMSQLGIKILSAATFSESDFDNNNSVFNANNYDRSIRVTTPDIGDQTNLQSVASIVHTKSTTVTGASLSSEAVFHVPAMTVFKSNEANKKPVKIPINKILSNVNNNIKRYGYAVIVFHPQDFVKTDQKGKLTNNLDEKELNDLSSLIDYLLSKEIPFTTMSKLVGIKPREFTAFPN
jgi:peptidoglycan/xylan/chitin deacetylase (PgdA/CDA1 family)